MGCRAGASVLQTVRLEQLVARSDDEYVAIASTLAHDLDRLREMRATLRNHMRDSTLIDPSAFMNNLESIYRRSWLAFLKS